MGTYEKLRSDRAPCSRSMYIKLRSIKIIIIQRKITPIPNGTKYDLSLKGTNPGSINPEMTYANAKIDAAEIT